ncbi:MAG: fumarylacetoacetate hydrolase family protein [Desulfatirhabdiaceae bacterium]|jgi:2-keto-4-pentenoate hydratase/2-oxohepta-3-ene-1,7-dioic acid hydratase in catechol pathway|nr:fumarylacetoacetate hydrolase family protein [Desulfatirhabdiaceae bacterium]
MKLIRMIHNGQIKPGLWKDGRIVDLKTIFPSIPDIGETFFTEGWLEKISAVKDPGHALDVRLTSPICRPSKIICLGKNYAEHAKEGGFDNPDKPLLFSKAPSALSGPFDPILLPKSCGRVDWEVELAVIIGKKCKRISRTNAMDHIAGFTVMNDVSAREAQFGDGQWFRGKSLDTFAPLGPVLVTPDEIDNINNLQLTTRVDGVLMQDGNTANLIFDIPFLIEYISKDMTLIPGDIISTGTPSGVGIFRNPPIVLKPGNIVECRIEAIGSIINPVMEG